MANIGPKGKMDFKFVDLNGGGGNSSFMETFNLRPEGKIQNITVKIHATLQAKTSRAMYIGLYTTRIHMA